MKQLSWVLVAMLLALPGVPTARSAEKAFTEYDTKALFIVNLIKMTEWPAERFADASAPYVIGIIGRNPFGRSFKPFEGKQIKNRPVNVREFDSAEAAAKEAQVVFIAASERSRFKDITAQFAGLPVLTISDAEGFAERGGIVEVSLESKRIVFEFNQTAANSSALVVSSQVLKLARSIKK